MIEIGEATKVISLLAGKHVAKGETFVDVREFTPEIINALIELSKKYDDDLR